MNLSAEQWDLVRPLFPPSPPCRRGRPRNDPRPALAGVLHCLALRLPWDTVPPDSAPWQTCYRLYRRWQVQGSLRASIDRLLDDARRRGGFDLEAAVRCGQVRFLADGGRVGVYLHAGIAAAWQAQTALLYYQRVAVRLERKAGIRSLHPDPLSALYPALEAESPKLVP